MELIFSHERVLERRKALGLTQEQVARRADVSLTTYVQLENGHKVPLVTTFARIAMALSKPPAWFFTSKAA